MKKTFQQAAAETLADEEEDEAFAKALINIPEAHDKSINAQRKKLIFQYLKGSKETYSLRYVIGTYRKLTIEGFGGELDQWLFPKTSEDSLKGRRHHYFRNIDGIRHARAVMLKLIPFSRLNMFAYYMAPEGNSIHLDTIFLEEVIPKMPWDVLIHLHIERSDWDRVRDLVLKFVRTCTNVKSLFIKERFGDRDLPFEEILQARMENPNPAYRLTVQDATGDHGDPSDRKSGPDSDDESL
jgi:hypothetical protein